MCVQRKLESRVRYQVTVYHKKARRTIVFYTSQNVQRGPEGYSHISEHFLKFPEDCRWNLNVL